MANLHQRPAWGYLYIAWLGIVFVVLLIVNFNLVSIALASIPALAANRRATQMLQFFLPVILIFLEFWLYDWLNDRADQADEASESSPRETQ
jgi:hypothetical protein